MNDFLKDIIKTTGNEYAALVSDGVEAGDVDSFIDTGSYIFNALLSGSIYGGLPNNKITAIAGESASGKSLIVTQILANTQKMGGLALVVRNPLRLQNTPWIFLRITTIKKICTNLETE